MRRLEPATPDVTVRVETKQGEEAQVDFGYARANPRPTKWTDAQGLGIRHDPFLESTPVRRTGLRPERRNLAEAAHQRLRLLQRRTQRIVLDNLKAGVVRASVKIGRPAQLPGPGRTLQLSGGAQSSPDAPAQG